MGGILGFDALCSSSVTVSESQNSSRRGSTISVQVSVRLCHWYIIESSGGGSSRAVTAAKARDPAGT